MMRRNTSFIKDLQCLCLYWGIDVSDGKVNKTLMDFCCEIEKFYNESKAKMLDVARNYPDADMEKNNGDIVDSIIDAENKKYIFVFENNTKLSVDIEKMIGGNTHPADVDESFISSMFTKIIDNLKKGDSNV
jgi:hypothetical protein